MTSRPRVICAVNHFGWCFDNHSRQIAHRLADTFDVSVQLESDFTGQHNHSADVLIIFSWPILAKINTSPFRSVIACLCDHWSISAFRSPRFFELVREKAHAVAVVNQDLQRQIARHMNLPVFLIEPGTDCNLFQAQPFPDKLRFGWCGNSQFAHSNAKIIDGKGVTLITRAAELTGAELISFDAAESAPVPHSEMSTAFYRKISVYLCASISEGTPNPILEALACGRPVITTDVGIVPRLIQNNVTGLIVERDIRCFASAIRRFIDKDLNPEEMSTACRRSAQQYDWSNKIAAWNHCLHSVISQHNSP